METLLDHNRAYFSCFSTRRISGIRFCILLLQISESISSDWYIGNSVVLHIFVRGEFSGLDSAHFSALWMERRCCSISRAILEKRFQKNMATDAIGATKLFNRKKDLGKAAQRDSNFLCRRSFPFFLLRVILLQWSIQHNYRQISELLDSLPTRIWLLENSKCR